MRVINEERSRLTEWRRQLEVTAEKVNADKQDIEQQQRLLTVEKRKLENLAQQVRDKSAEIDELVAVCPFFMYLFNACTCDVANFLCSRMKRPAVVPFPGELTG
jgi:hypothetical protein